MNWPLVFVLVVLGTQWVQARSQCCDGQEQRARQRQEMEPWKGSWSFHPTTATWSMQTKIPMIQDFAQSRSDVEEPRGKLKVKKKFKKFLLPLLLAYKLKFFTLIPVLIGGLLLLTGATGLAGFFFALFAAVMGLKSSGHH